MSGDKLDNIIQVSRKTKPFKDPLVIFVMILSGIFVIWIFWGNTADKWAIWANAGGLHDNDTPILTKTAGSWGDSFGAFNALFGAFGFAAVSLTLYLQFKANEQQRIDLHIQRFEATFFELIKLMRELRSEICFKTSSLAPSSLAEHLRSNEPVYGTEAIRNSYSEITSILQVILKRKGDISKSQIAMIYIKVVHKRYGYSFSPYFRIIYSILQNILSDNILAEDQKYYYARILRAQLSTQEIALLGFNSCAKISKDLGDKIRTFRMLKYLPNNTAKRALSFVYKPEVFSSRD